MNARELLIHNAQYLTDDGMTFIDEMEYFNEEQEEWRSLEYVPIRRALFSKLRIKPKKTKKQILIDYLDYFDDNMKLNSNVEFYTDGRWQPVSNYYEHHSVMITDYPVRMNGS